MNFFCQPIDENRVKILIITEILIDCFTDSNISEDPLAKRSKVEENGEKFDSAAKIPDPTKNPEYLAAVKRLNTNFLAFLQRHFTECPYLDLSPCFADYQKHIAKLEQKFEMKNGEGLNIFGGGSKQTESIQKIPNSKQTESNSIQAIPDSKQAGVAGPPNFSQIGSTGIFGTENPNTAPKDSLKFSGGKFK